MNKKIEFDKISNMAIEINEMLCSACKVPFYELERHELGQCPSCGYHMDNDPTRINSDCNTYLLIVDPKTGVPTILKRGKAAGQISGET